jgi:chromosome segregation protein
MAVDTHHMADTSRAWPQWAIIIGLGVALWSMHDDVKKAQAAADGAEGEVATLRAKVEELSDDIDECESKAKDADDKAEDLDSKVSDLDSRVDDLESK